MISLKSISYSVNGRKIINDLTVDFIPGKLHVIIGPNGAGKSTLLKILSKQLNPSEGVVSFENRSLKDYSYQELARKRAVLSQEIDMAFPLSVQEFISLGRYPHFKDKPNETDLNACREAMAFFDVSQFSERDFNSLSGGEKQRVQFARVLSQIWCPVKNSCRYLFVDEPLTFLDIKYQYEFMDKLKSLATHSDMVIIAVIHDLSMAAKFGDIIYLLNKGEIYKMGTPFSVITNENISSVFEIDTKLLELRP